MTTCIDSIIDEFTRDFSHYSTRIPGFRKWYSTNEIKAYLRLGLYLSPFSSKVMVATIVLATVEVESKFQREGLCTELITKLEELAQSKNYYFRIENVLHPGLGQFLTKRNYVKTQLNDYWFNNLSS
jgi:hypothetical protein